ncbi:hypothetical protein QYH69_01990 [Paraburkholderia sp. SARCC-3016]|jgi:hypothetical protein|uniref:hypothetical protein n=1 Tax=Paraburkholderia sp. SARCC-3016 TaxID=3058611 RepID=UPI002807A886|nr:hypothetical protein [Paraburkholderia sp. SARCC-3016]MDQ7976017.1 hypothetical protein [Paraburkholderia sp. SARCC-3016]
MISQMTIYLAQTLHPDDLYGALRESQVSLLSERSRPDGQILEWRVESAGPRAVNLLCQSLVERELAKTVFVNRLDI